MALQNGQSVLDSVSLRIPDLQKEIKNWNSYTLSTDFLTPCDKFQFRVSSQDDVTLVNEVLVPGVKVQLVINNHIQCTGFIDNIEISGDRNGTDVIIEGRDILGRVVSSRTNYEIEYTTSMTVLDVLNKTLPTYGITKYINDDQLNINVITGYEKGKGKYYSQTVEKPVIVGFKQNPDKSYILDSNKQKIPIKEKKKVTETKAANKPGLKDLRVDQLKPKAGEGEYAFIDRILKRHGLVMRAMADGSGVVIDKPNFTGPMLFNIFNRTGELRDLNNVLKFHKKAEFVSQPSLIVGAGFGGGKTARKSQFKAIIVNELVGLDDNGNILPEIQVEIAKHPGFKALPLRKELIPSRKLFSQKLIPCFDYFHDDESKSQEQLEKMITRRLAEDQQKALVLTYTVEGHTQNGIPWCVNTLVNVDDDINNIHEKMWILNRRFEKTKSGGTKTTLTLIRPYTLLL